MSGEVERAVELVELEELGPGAGDEVDERILTLPTIRQSYLKVSMQPHAEHMHDAATQS